MLRWILAVSLLAPLTGLLAADEKKSSFTAQVSGLSVHKPVPAKKKERFTFVQTGTILEVTFLSDDKYILGVDAKASKLDQFTDDKKSKLNSGSLFGGPNWLGGFPQLAPDGERCVVQINGQTPPAKGANKVLAKGTIILKCGAEEKTTEKKDITIKMGAETTVGAFTIKVSGEGSNFSGPGIEIVSEERIVKSAHFFDAKGAAIELNTPPFMHPVFAGGGKMLHALTYNLPKKIDKVSVKIAYFAKVESLPAPFDLSVGLGLD
jgi:hypothetical protein